MAINYRKPGGPDFGATGNWDIALASGDDLRVVEGAQDFDSGLDQSSKDFLSVFFESSFGGPAQATGSASAFLKFNCNQTGTGKVKIAHQGAELYIQAASTSGVHNEVEIYPRSPTMRIVYGDSTINKLLIESGQCDFGGGCTLPASNPVNILGGSHKIQAHTAGTNEPTIHAYGGQLLLQRDFTDLFIYAGAQVTLDLPTGTTGGNIYLRGGSLTHLKGSLGTIFGFAGRYDRSRLARPATGTAYHKYAQLIEVPERTAAAVVTFTNTYTYGSGARQAG